MSEKVIEPRSGRLVTRNHPHEIISPHVMRFEDIRYWLRELSTNPAYGWYPGGVAGLVRALGMSSHGTLKEKLVWRWIWPREQVRLSARIREILDGYIVPVRGKGAMRPRVDGVFVDPPRPPNVKRQKVLKFHATVGGGFTHSTQGRGESRPLPSFSRAFAEAMPWSGDEKKAPVISRGLSPPTTIPRRTARPL